MTTASGAPPPSLSQAAIEHVKERAASDVICTLIGTIEGSLPGVITSSVVCADSRSGLAKRYRRAR